MIDAKALKEIEHRIQRRESWIELMNIINETKSSNAAFCGSQSIKLILAKHSAKETAVWFETDDLEKIVKIKILELDKELFSLGFQPSPLDLKEGEKAND